MYCVLNIPEAVFNENFWKKVQEESVKGEPQNNFYAFYKRGTPTFINASNDYDMLLKLHKNTKTFIDEMPIYVEIMDWRDDKRKKKEFDTEEEMYKYYVEEILALLRICDYYYEKLDIIQ